MISILLVAGPDSAMTPSDVERLKSRCLVSATTWWSLTSYLRLDLAAKHAMVDAIALFPSEIILDYAAECRRVVEDVRELPENCCMRDGRKWKRIPFVALSENRFIPGWHLLHDAGVPIVQYSSRLSLESTIYQLQRIVDKYFDRALSDYQKVGFLVDCDHGRCRVKWAYRRKDPAAETEYYHSSADRRRLTEYVTVHRNEDGIAYEARLFEELINDRKTSERDIQKFFEQHPAFLMDAMQGVPIPHRPILRDPKGWTPDFVLPSMTETKDTNRVVQLAELKGVHVPLLSGKVHRGLSHHVMAAIDQIRDYERVLRENRPTNMKPVTDAIGFVPKEVRLAVVLGRAPSTHAEKETLERRAMFVPDVRIVPYDEILQTQHQQIR